MLFPSRVYDNSIIGKVTSTVILEFERCSKINMMFGHENSRFHPEIVIVLNEFLLFQIFTPVDVCSDRYVIIILRTIQFWLAGTSESI